MDMDRAFGSTGGATGEVQQRPIFRGGEREGEGVGFCVQQRMKGMNAGFRTAAIRQQHMRQIRQILSLIHI